MNASMVNLLKRMVTAKKLTFLATRWRLQTAPLSARNRLRKINESDNLCVAIETFLDSITKGSKKFRLIIDQENAVANGLRNMQTVTSFALLTDTIVTETGSV